MKTHAPVPNSYVRPDATRSSLLARLQRSGHLLVTPVTEDEFTQMSVKDCRDYVNSVENLLRKLASGAC
jgi:hypothetical protein